MSQQMIVALNEFRLARIHHDPTAEHLAVEHINQAGSAA